MSQIKSFPECSDDSKLCKNIMEWGGVGEKRAMYNTGPIPFMKRIFPSLGESEEPGTNLAVSEVGRITLAAC